MTHRRHTGAQMRLRHKGARKRRRGEGGEGAARVRNACPACAGREILRISAALAFALHSPIARARTRRRKRVEALRWGA